MFADELMTLIKRCADVRIADVQMCGCADVRMCRCTDVQMCRCANVRICRCMDVHLPVGRQGCGDMQIGDDMSHGMNYAGPGPARQYQGKPLSFLNSSSG